MSHKRRILLAAVVATGLFGIPQTSHAVVYTWTNGASDGNLSNPNNYTPFDIGGPLVADTVVFNGTTLASPTTGTLNVRYIEFNPGAPSYTFGSGVGDISIPSNGNIDIFSAIGGTQTFQNSAITLAGVAPLYQSSLPTVGGLGEGTSALVINTGAYTMGSGLVQSRFAPITFNVTGNTNLGTGVMTAGAVATSPATASIAINGNTVVKPGGSMTANNAPITIGSTSFETATTAATTFTATNATITATPRILLNGGATARNLTLTGASNIAINGGFGGLTVAATAGANVTKAGLGTLFVGASDAAWIGNLTLGISSGANTDYGNIEINSANSLGAAGTSARGYTDLGPSKSGSLILNLTGTNTINEYFYARGRLAANTPQIVNTSGTNTLAGDVNVEGAASSGTNIGYRVDGGSLLVSGTIDNNAATARTLNLLGLGSGEISGLLAQTGTGAWNVAKDDGGTWTLSGLKGYTGTTTVTAGILRLNATHTAGDVYTVGGGATLAGTGSTTSAVSGAGIVGPGNNGIGILTVGGFDVDNLAIDFNTAAGTTDLLNVTGNLDFGNITFTNLGVGTPNVPLLFATFLTSTGSASFVAPTGYDVVFTPTTASLVPVAVPEPSTLVLAALGMVGLGAYGLRRRNSKSAV